MILFNKTWISFISQLGEAGVNIFVLISAYFLIDNTKFRTRKILSIIIEMLTYSIIIGVSFLFINGKGFSFTLFKNIFFPFGSSTWWFMTSYLLLYLFSPLLNVGIKAINRKAHLFLLILFVIIWSFLPTFLRLQYGFSQFGWFIVLYLAASYIKIYDIDIKFRPYQGILLSCFLFSLWFSIRCIIGYFFGDNYYVTHILQWFNLIEINNFIQFISTILLFLSFKKMEIRNIKPINIIASTTLGIYLFHDHADIRKLLWVDLFKNSSYATYPFLVFYSLVVILIVFVCGVLIDLLYKITFGTLYNKLLHYLDRKCLYKIDGFMNEEVGKRDETTI